MADITQEDLREMIQHWLHTPIGTYLGSDYGFDKHALLFKPLTANGADEMIAKLKRDIPVLTLFNSDNINFYSLTLPPDRNLIFLEVGNLRFEI